MSDSDASLEILEPSPQKNEHELNFPENSPLLPEFHELLKPSQEVVHQTGLELVNTRLLVDSLSKSAGKPMTLDKVSAEDWSRLFKHHDSIWFMGIYKPSEFSRQHAIKYADQYKYALPDLDPERDVAASPFAVPDYSPNPKIAASWQEWDHMVEQLHALKKKVFVDFVPNHMAVDHPWSYTHPDYFIQGTEEQYRQNPSRYHAVTAENGRTHYLAHGKDPNYPEWADTLQLNYARPQVQQEMKNILLNLTKHADGVRCDMAMLLNGDTFKRTWSDHLHDEEKNYISKHNFWQNAIPEVKKTAKLQGAADFIFIAEAYWDKELLGEQFDYIYGKDFYDHIKRIVHGSERPQNNVVNHINYLMTAVKNGRHYRDVLFIENHDEERAAKEFGNDASKAMAVLTGLIPESIFLINQGQEEGRKIRPPMQISRMPQENRDEETQRFYNSLLALKRSTLFQKGNYETVNPSSAYDTFVALHVSMPVENKSENGAVVCVNIGSSTISGRIPFIGKSTDAEVYRLLDGQFVLNSDQERDGGMYIELGPWETQVVFYRTSKSA